MDGDLDIDFHSKKFDGFITIESDDDMVSLT